MMDDKPSTRKDKIKNGLRRAMWLFMTLLFVLSGIVVGIYYFWQATRGDQNQAQTSQAENRLAGKPLENFEPVSEVSKLMKIDQKVGSGAEAKSGSKVIVVYTGAIASTGVVFESSVDSGQPAQFTLNNDSGLIKGWLEGIPGMKVGGQRRLLIPSDMAYGANPSPGGTIPPNADLVFDVTLLAVE